MAKLKLENLCLNYHTLKGETEALKNLNLEVQNGEFISIVGPSGCGKSTLLSLISGLLKPSSGKILLDGFEIDSPCGSKCTKIGYMLQRDHLFEWRTIFKNITIGLEIQGKLNKDSIKNVEYMLKKYGLDGFKNYYPQQLSGGMRQRVALIRTLATDPDILLLDEPFSAIDYQTRIAVSDEIYKIIKEEKKTTIMVTHDIADAMFLKSNKMGPKAPLLLLNLFQLSPTFLTFLIILCIRCIPIRTTFYTNQLYHLPHP